MDTKNIYKALKVSVSSNTDRHKTEYSIIKECKNIESVIKTICSSIGELCKNEAILELKSEIKHIHSYLKFNFNRKEDPELSPIQYSNSIIMSDPFGGFHVRVKRVLIDKSTNQIASDYCIHSSSVKQDTSWGAHLSSASKRMLSVADLSYFTFLEMHGAKINLPKELIYKDKIKGFWEFQVAGLLLSAMSYEGYINYIGSSVFKSWSSDIWQNIKDKPEVLKKTTVIINELNLDINEMERPYSSVVELFRLRNIFAHPKVDIRQIYTEKILPVKESVKDNCSSEEENDISRLQEARNRTESLVEILNTDIESLLKKIWSVTDLPDFEYIRQSKKIGSGTIIRMDDDGISSGSFYFEDKIKNE